MHGDRNVVYPILYFLLTRYSDLEKRAYLSKYLIPLEIPEDIIADQDVKDTF